MVTLVLPILAGLTFLAGLIQGWSSYIDMKNHYGQQKQRKFYIIVSIYLILTLLFVSATYIASFRVEGPPTNNNQHVPTQLSISPLATFNTAMTPSPSPIQPGVVLCSEDWQKGMDGWSGTPDWEVVDGVLINDGSNTSSNSNTLLSPCQPITRDYAVESTIQYIGGGYGFGILARGGGPNGYEGWVSVEFTAPGLLAGIAEVSQTPFDFLADNAYTVDNAWHTYRLEVRGLNLTFFIDGSKIVSATSASYLSAGRVGLTVNGLWSGCQIAVKSFQVTSL